MHPTRHKIDHFRDIPQANRLIGECVLLLCYVLFFHTKPKETYYNTKN